MNNPTEHEVTECVFASSRNLEGDKRTHINGSVLCFIVISSYGSSAKSVDN